MPRRVVCKSTLKNGEGGEGIAKAKIKEIHKMEQDQFNIATLNTERQ